MLQKWGKMTEKYDLEARTPATSALLTCDFNRSTKISGDSSPLCGLGTGTSDFFWRMGLECWPKNKLLGFDRSTLGAGEGSIDENTAIDKRWSNGVFV